MIEVCLLYVLYKQPDLKVLIMVVKNILSPPFLVEIKMCSFLVENVA